MHIENKILQVSGNANSYCSISTKNISKPFAIINNNAHHFVQNTEKFAIQAGFLTTCAMRMKSVLTINIKGGIILIIKGSDKAIYYFSLN